MRATQHPFTPEPREPEPWPDRDAPSVARWNPELGGITAPGDLLVEIVADGDLKRMRDHEKSQRVKYRKRGFSIGFGSFEG